MYKKLIHIIQSQFRFNSQQASGFILIIVIVLICLFAPMFTASLWRQPQYDIAKDIALQDSLNRLLALHQEKISIIKSQKEWVSSKKIITPFNFNPNTATEEQLTRLGLSKYVVKNILNFVSKGGKFRTKKDFAKIYGLDAVAYSSLSPYLQLPDTLVRERFENKFPNKNNYKKPVTITSFDINTADTTALIALKGIGSKLAIRIIKYRDGLGGFINMNQYKEVYGLDSVAISQLTNYAYIKPDFKPKKINLHSATLLELQAHPYLGNKAGKIFYNYLMMHPSMTEEDVLEIKGIKSDNLDKLRPYLQ